LTSLLKQSIGGNSYCLMIACLSPSDAFVEENLSTLAYATKASFISNEPVKNEDPKMKMINELKLKVQTLQRELAQANDHIQFLSNVHPGQADPAGKEVPRASLQDEPPRSSPAEKPKPQVEVSVVQKRPAERPQQAEYQDAFHRLDQNVRSFGLINL
jgi:hypothetical protein